MMYHCVCVPLSTSAVRLVVTRGTHWQARQSSTTLRGTHPELKSSIYTRKTNYDEVTKRNCYKLSEAH